MKRSGFLDTIFVERRRRTAKYECVYLHAWEDWIAGQGRCPPMARVLQSQAPALSPWRSAARHGLPAEN